MSQLPEVIKAAFDDGEWYAMTLGEFVGILVDAGQDPAVKFRVLEDSEPDERGKFTRRIEMIMLPDGYVVEAAKSSKGVHKTLLALIEGGVVS